MSRDIPSRRVLAEGLVIVCSILLAFGIDAWWDRSQDRAEEIEILSGLRAEFEGYRTAMARFEARNDSILDALVVLMRDDLPTLASSDRDSAMRWLLWVQTYDPGKGVRDALITSGRLELIRSTDLRGRLARWEGLVDEIRDNEQLMRSYTFDSIIPYIVESGDLFSRAYSRGSRPWPLPLQSDAETLALYERLASRPDFSALLAVRYSWARGTGDEYRAAQIAAEEIVRLIDDQLR